MTVIEALEACGTVAECFAWAFKVNACLGFCQALFATGSAVGPEAGTVAASKAICDSVRKELESAPGAAVVVRGHPSTLSYRVAHQARQEVAGFAPLGAFVVYALCPDATAGSQVQVGIAIARRT
jgi:hypothetical protein